MTMFKFDFNNINKNVIGEEHGLDLEYEYSAYSEKMANIIEQIYEIQEIRTWLDGSYKNAVIDDIKNYTEMVHGKFENIIVLGLGGPMLGIKAMTEAVLNSYWNNMSSEQRNGYPKIFFINNIDTDNLSLLLKIGNIQRSLFIIMSRDGEEPETMSLFMLTKKYLEDIIGENYRMHIVVCTKYGSLFHNIASQEGYKYFLTPYQSIGSFAIMSTSGLLPLALAGINIEEMLKGAKDLVKESFETDIYKNVVAQASLIQYLYCIKKKKKISVLMSYSSRFKEIAGWCSQYKAERLSKDYDRQGNLICSGLIPVSVFGCNDQNTFLQMLIEGDNNKLINIVKIEECEQDFEIPQIFDYTPIGYLGGKSLSFLLNAEIEAMRMVLTDYQRPNLTVTIPKITPYYVGKYMALYMLSMVIQASLYNIDPLDREGSENLQNYICAQMGRYGYDETLNEMREKQEKIKQQSVLLE